MSKVITAVNPCDVQINTHSAGHVVTVLADTPGGKPLRLVIKLNNDHWLGCIARRVHQALHEREREIASIRRVVETGQ